jgi:hypothetical protein
VLGSQRGFVQSGSQTLEIGFGWFGQGTVHSQTPIIQVGERFPYASNSGQLSPGFTLDST